jgi:hypothetical protein
MIPGGLGPLTVMTRTGINSKRQIHPLVGEGAIYQQIRNYLTVIKIWCWDSDGA